VARCLARALWGEAAARMALGEWAAAGAACTRALAALRGGAAGGGAEGGGGGGGGPGGRRPPSADASLEARVLLRRAKARLAVHEHQARGTGRGLPDGRARPAAAGKRPGDAHCPRACRRARAAAAPRSLPGAVGAGSRRLVGSTAARE
jgi:hypothetical protein